MSPVPTTQLTTTTALVDVLPLVIQHSNICSRWGSVCSLLCTSQEVAEAVQKHCIGRLHLKETGPAQMAWLARYCPLVSELWLAAGTWDAARLPAIEQGLAAAAARWAGGADAAALSQLRSVRAVSLPRGALSRLRPFRALTSLSLQGFSFCIDESDEAAALGRLTSLQHLVLNSASEGLLPGTSALTNVTSLSLSQLRPKEGVPRLQHLPPQLLQLTMTLCREQPVIDLSHVTGLTRLVAVPFHESDGLDITPGVALPAKLEHLAVADVLSLQPLLQLPLQRLELHSCYDVCEERILQLSSLTGLSHLQVTPAKAEEFEPTADALPRLASLCGLQVGRWLWRPPPQIPLFNAPALRTLPQLRALHSLRLHRLQLADSSSCRVADVLRALSGLQHLGIAECEVGSGSAAWAGVAAAIASLSTLRDVRLAEISQWSEAASVALSAATQLTSLMVCGGHLKSVVGQVHKLSGLCRLWIGEADTFGAGGFDVDAAAAGLRQLNQLCMRVEGNIDLLAQRLPGVAVGHVAGCRMDRLERSSWRVQWWSRDKEAWEEDT